MSRFIIQFFRHHNHSYRRIEMRTLSLHALLTTELVPDLNSTEDEEASNVFYVRNGTPVTYTYFTLNVAMIVIHIGIIVLNTCMIEAIRKSRKVEEPCGHCLISKCLIPTL